MTKILAIATCYNRKKKTITSINSLVNGNEKAVFDFVICDDNSTDGTSRALSAFDNVQIINGTGNLFWCGGMRKAIGFVLNQNKDYDYCLLFNDDVEFYPGVIDYLIEKDENIVWVGPTEDNEGNLSYGGIIRMSSIRPKYQTIKAVDENGIVCDTFNANCVLIPWKILIAVGNMDPVYTHSMGDFDYGFNIVKKGYKIKVSDCYVGICNNNRTKNTWEDKTLSIKKRIDLKENDKGLPFRQWFHYLNKNYNFITAVIYSITPYIKILLKK